MKKQKGQASLVVLLMLALASTVGLITSRNVLTDIQMTKVQEEAIRAFSAAEAGMEKALYSWQTGETIPEEVTLETGKAQLSAEELGKNQTSFVFPHQTEAGDFNIVWLTAHSGDGEIDELNYYEGSALNICWQEDSALELALFYKSTTDTYKTASWATDAVVRDNNFDTDIGSGCAGLNYSKQLTFPADTAIPLFLVVKVYYQDTQLGAEAVGEGVVFPSQGQQITSVGEVEKGEEVVSRRLRVFQSWDLPPFVFLEPLFSRGATEISD